MDNTRPEKQHQCEHNVRCHLYALLSAPAGTADNSAVLVKTTIDEPNPTYASIQPEVSRWESSETVAMWPGKVLTSSPRLAQLDESRPQRGASRQLGRAQPLQKRSTSIKDFRLAKQPHPKTWWRKTGQGGRNFPHERFRCTDQLGRCDPSQRPRA